MLQLKKITELRELSINVSLHFLLCHLDLCLNHLLNKFVDRFAPYLRMDRWFISIIINCFLCTGWT